MVKNDVYLYGMILITNSFLLKDHYPEPDTYCEIEQKYTLPGGETGTCATVLASLGCKVIMDGTNMGNRTYPLITQFYQDKTVDTSRLYWDTSYDGLEDYVLIDRTTRTPFGTFGSYYSNPLHRWNIPADYDILNSKVVGLDPWFMDQTNRIVMVCRNNGIPYVTIDCPYDSDCHKYSQINILSNEFLSTTYPGRDRTGLYQEYVNHSNGLVIFTLGAKEIIYGRKDEKVKYIKPYSVQVISTLGAGDCFKAGCIYALLHNMKDDDIVLFAAATAACACTAFPIPLNPPTLEKILELQGKH